jgi:hypothetical protein
MNKFTQKSLAIFNIFGVMAAISNLWTGNPALLAKWGITGYLIALVLTWVFMAFEKE